MTPMTIRCNECRHFKGVKRIPALPLVLFQCPAFPRDIPEDIRDWSRPHTAVREDQQGTLVFEAI
jgi:hypothetical protein